MAAIPWYKLVPSIFIVVPIGRTKLLTSSSTPRCSCTLSMVTGSVAADELVENANNCAGKIPFKKNFGVLVA